MRQVLAAKIGCEEGLPGEPGDLQGDEDGGISSAGLARQLLGVERLVTYAQLIENREEDP